MGFSATNIAITLPKISLLANDIGGVMVVPAPSTTTVGAIITLPAVVLQGQDATAWADITIPAPETLTDWVVVPTWNADLGLPPVETSGTAPVGLMGAASLRLAPPTITASGGSATYANIAVPIPLLSADGGEPIEWVATVTVPAAQLIGEILHANPFASADYAVWLVNRDTKAHSTYSNWPANSYGKFNGAEFIAAPDGIYELTGDTDGDDQIDAKVYWVPSDLGSSRQKRIDAAYVRLRGSGLPFRLLAWCDETEQRVYTADMFGFPDNIHPKRVLFTRNLQGAVWQIGFENHQGGDFDLAEIEIIPVVLSRRLK